jgi:hypothetical protein
MSPKRLIKFFVIALAFQLFFLLGGYALLFGPSGERNFRNSLLLYAYDPFIGMVIKAGGYEGESSMIRPPVFGILLGVLIYSAVFAFAVTFLRANDAKEHLRSQWPRYPVGAI